MAPAQLPVPESTPPQGAEPVSSLPEFGPSLPALRRSLPERYSGIPSRLNGFLLQCKMFSELSPSSFPNDKEKITFIQSRLSGKARKWAKTSFSSESRVSCTYEYFLKALSLAFSESAKSQGLSNFK